KPRRSHPRTTADISSFSLSARRPRAQFLLQRQAPGECRGRGPADGPGEDRPMMLQNGLEKKYPKLDNYLRVGMPKLVDEGYAPGLLKAFILDLPSDGFDTVLFALKANQGPFVTVNSASRYFTPPVILNVNERHARDFEAPSPPTVRNIHGGKIYL